jgi:hypothetical protein
LNDVNISSPTDGQALVCDNATRKWVNRAGGGGSSTFAGLNDVDVAGVANKDIIRYNSTTQKYEKSSDLTDLELSVSQLSSSVLNIAGDVDALELTVSQMSASTLPYDANTSIKQKIDNVESSIPTSASDLPYSSGVSTKDKIDEVVAGLTGWSSLETLYTDSGFVMKGATNSELKLAIIKLEGTANRPSVSGIATQLATKYKPFLTEPFARVRYGGDMWVNVSGELRLSGMDTSQAWQNGFLMYPTK